MATPYIEDFIKVNKYTRPGLKIKAVKKIVMHYTANPGASARNHVIYFGKTLIEQNEKLPEKDRRYASAQYFVDRIESIQIIPDNEVAYHANDVQKRNSDGTPYRGIKELLPNANELSIGIEMCIEKDGTIHPETLKRAEDLVIYLVKKYNLNPLTDILRHYDVTGKNCPAPWVSNPNSFISFKDGVDKIVNKKIEPVIEIVKGVDKILNLTGALKQIVLEELTDMTDSIKHGSNALSKTWLDKFVKGELTESEAIGILFAGRKRKI